MPFKVKKLTAIDTSSLDALGNSVVNLAKFTEDEFAQLASSLQDTEAKTVLYVPPPKPRQGTLVYADGTHWNPGAGEGFYEYTSAATWVPLFAVAGAPTVTSIAGNTGAFTLNATSGITNLVNDIRLSQASATQFGAVKVDNTTITAAAGVISAVNQSVMVLLETIPLTSGTIVPSTVSWAGYNHIKLIISNLSLSAVSNSPFIEVHSNGAYQNTNYISGASFVGLTGTPTFGTALTTVAGALLYGGTDLTLATVPEGVSLETLISNIASTTTHKHIRTEGSVRSSTTAYWANASSVWVGGNTALDGFRLRTTGGGSFVAGTLQIYGIK